MWKRVITIVWSPDEPEELQPTFEPREIAGGATLGGKDPGEISPKATVDFDLAARGGGGGLPTVDLSGGGGVETGHRMTNYGGADTGPSGGYQDNGASPLGRGAGTEGPDDVL